MIPAHRRVENRASSHLYRCAQNDTHLSLSGIGVLTRVLVMIHDRRKAGIRKTSSVTGGLRLIGTLVRMIPA
eukprot:4350659-Pyramimonas_sp.AAC.1